MKARLPRPSRSRERVLVWIGVALMIVSFVWWELLPSPVRTASENNAARESVGGLGLVIIDAGHGGQDSGTMHDGVLEKNLTLDVARRLDELLRVEGLATKLTRASDEYVSLGHRVETANRENDCVLVSIHFDEGNRSAASGVNTYFASHQAAKIPLLPSWLPFLHQVTHEPINFDSESLAGSIQESVVARTKAIDRGTRSEQFYVIANVRHPAVLVEGGFLTNSDDLGKLRREDYRQELAGAICDGIMRYRQLVRQRGIRSDEPRT